MYDFLKNRTRRIPECRVKIYLYQILKGLTHLHNNGLFHRDVKPENILIKLTPMGELIKLADLGSVRGIYSQPPYTEYISTRWYRSPECLLTVGNYGPKMDVWATGCVFYEILTLRPLFPGSNELDQLHKIHSILGTPDGQLLEKLKHKSRNCTNFPKTMGSGLNSLLNGFSEQAKRLLTLMLEYDPDKRVQARRLLQSIYFDTIRYGTRGQAYKKEEDVEQPIEKPRFIKRKSLSGSTIVKEKANSQQKSSLETARSKGSHSTFKKSDTKIIKNQANSSRNSCEFASKQDQKSQLLSKSRNSIDGKTLKLINGKNYSFNGDTRHHSTDSFRKTTSSLLHFVKPYLPQKEISDDKLVYKSFVHPLKKDSRKKVADENLSKENLGRMRWK